MNKKEIGVFIAVSVLCGWVGVLVNVLLKQPMNDSSLGLLLWLVLPLFCVVILRTIKKDWKNSGLGLKLRGNIKWYLIAILSNIVVAVFCFGIGLLTKTYTYNMPETDVLIPIIISAILSQLLKNVFEEFAWRGYLTQKLEAGNVNDFIIYLIVGVVWALWHLAYYTVFLDIDESVLTGGSVTSHIISSFIILLIWSVMYVEMYRLTHSIWPCILMHSISNVIQFTFIYADDGIKYSSKLVDTILNPVSGVVSAILFLGFGLWLRSCRKKKASAIEQ